MQSIVSQHTHTHCEWLLQYMQNISYIFVSIFYTFIQNTPLYWRDSEVPLFKKHLPIYTAFENATEKGLQSKCPCISVFYTYNWDPGFNGMMFNVTYNMQIEETECTNDNQRA